MADPEALSVLLSPELRAFVRAQVDAGRFTDDSEVIRAALRLFEDHERHERLEQTLLRGLDSGPPQEASEKYWESLRERARRAVAQDRDSA